MHSLAGSDALVDGNKRLAWAATRVFLILNDRDLHFSVDEAESVVVSGPPATTTPDSSHASSLRISPERLHLPPSTDAQHPLWSFA